MLFRLNSPELALVLAAIVFGATGVAIMLGRRHRERSEMREPFAVLQGALLGVVGLILAFGLSLAVGRYEDRRAAVVDESNAIGTTYLRAQALPEPTRTRSMDLLRQFTDSSIRIANTVPASAEQDAAIADGQRTEQRCGRRPEAPSTPDPRRARHACTWRVSTRPSMLNRAAS